MPSHLDLVHTIFGNAFRISRWYIPGHDGIDLPAKTGTPIRAVKSGVVSYARDARLDPNAGRNWAIEGGNVVNIDVGGQLTTQYAHLDKIYVRAGQHVKAGQIIGTVGSTGGKPDRPGGNFGASNAHLHFGLWNRRINKMVEPTAFLAAAAAGWDDVPTVRDQWYNDEKQLAAWGNVVSFPDGHILTADDVDTIMAKLRAAHFFDDPVSGAVAESVTRDVLRKHIGEPWNKSLQDRLQVEFGEAAKEAGDAGGLAAIGDVVGKLADPGNWVRILAILGGAIIFGVGAYGVLRATGPVPSVRPV